LDFTLTGSLGLPPAAEAAGDPQAEVDGVPISSEEVEKSLTAQLSKIEEQVDNLKRQRVEALINDKLLEKESVKRGLSVPALLDAEVTAKVALVTEQEIEDFYQQNKAHISGEEADVRQKIRSYLKQQKLTARREAFVASLRSQASNGTLRRAHASALPGTPAFFINGRPLQGAQPLEAFPRVIEEELARGAASRSGVR
jgi:hypothetical protein